MKWPALLTFLSMWTLLAGPGFAAEPDSNQTDAIRERIKSYVASFNRGDAKEAAAHWSESAEYTIPDLDQRFRGRKAIQAALEELMKTDEQFQLSFSDQKFRFVTDSVAVEEGTARLLSMGRVPEQARYAAVHVMKNGSWYRDSVHETRMPATISALDQLSGLTWLVGSWNRKGENESVSIQCRWTHNKNFLSRNFQIVGKGSEKLTGTQMIGWDPSSGLIRSWTFDSEGGFEQAVWDQVGDHWSVKAAVVLPDGRTGSEQRIITPVDENSFTWKAVNRQVDGGLVAGSDEVKLTRND